MERSSHFSLVVICGVNVGDFGLCWDDCFSDVPCRVRVNPVSECGLPWGVGSPEVTAGKRQVLTGILSLDVQDFCLFLGLSSVSVDVEECVRTSGAVCFYSIELVFLSAETLQWHWNFSISWGALSLNLGGVQPEIATQLGKDGWEGLEEATWRFCWWDSCPSWFILCHFRRYFAPSASSIIMNDFPWTLTGLTVEASPGCPSGHSVGTVNWTWAFTRWWLIVYKFLTLGATCSAISDSRVFLFHWETLLRHGPNSFRPEPDHFLLRSLFLDCVE